RRSHPRLTHPTQPAYPTQSPRAPARGLVARPDSKIRGYNPRVTAIRAHFDGQTIVPDEPVDLPKGRPLIISVETAEGASVEQLQQRPPVRFNSLRGKVRISRDFDAPIDDFQDYM